MNYNSLTLTGSAAPHIRTGSSVRHMMLTVMTALLPALGFAVFDFGVRALVNVLASMLGCCVFELIFRLIRRQNITIGDLSAALTGMLIAFACPVTVPYWLLLMGDFFAIVVIKQLFGGIGKNYLNPALAARALLSFWTGGMLWTAPRTLTALWGPVDAVTSPTPLSFLRENDPAGLQELYTLPELFVGLTSGAMGEVCTLLLLLGGLFLISRKVISWRIPVCYLGTAAALTFLLSWGNDRTAWMLSQLLSGGLVLTAFFMAADPVTSPVSRSGQLLYGIGCGALTVLLRYYGFCNEGAGFAVLLMNLTARPLDELIFTGHIERPHLPKPPEKSKGPAEAKTPKIPKITFGKKPKQE